MVKGYVCNDFLATARDKNRCHICCEPKSAHTKANVEQTRQITDDSAMPTADELRAHLRGLIDAQVTVEKSARTRAHDAISGWTDAEVYDQWFMNFPEEIVSHLLNQDAPVIDEEIHFSPGDLNDSF